LACDILNTAFIIVCIPVKWKVIIMFNRVLIIGDSMALPREGVPYESSWPYLIQSKYQHVDIINRSLRGATVARLVLEGGGREDIVNYPAGSDCLEFYSPSIVILQLGIVDCAPRLLSKKAILSKLINRLPLYLQTKVINFLKKSVGRSKKNAYISSNQYRKNIVAYIERALLKNVKHIIAVEIGTVSDGVSRKSPQILEQIKEYNEILIDISEEYNIFNVIKFGSEKENINACTTDGYHLNCHGHYLLANSIESKLLQVVSNET
jgi:acyl-CoA thioesterase-1